MSLAETPAASRPVPLPTWQRLFFAIPILGWIARDVTQGGAENLWYAIVLFVSLWGISALTFGLPGLFLPALAMVPVIFAVLLLITWG